jgi:hypothetical protein
VNKDKEEAPSEGEASQEELEEDDSSSSDEEVSKPIKEDSTIAPRKSRRLASKAKVGKDEATSSHPTKQTDDAPPSPKPASPIPVDIPSSPPSPIPTSPTPTGFARDDSPFPPTPIDLILGKFDVLQSQLCAFQSEVRASLSTIAEQLTDMETRLGAKLDTVEVQTEFVDEETAA